MAPSLLAEVCTVNRLGMTWPVLPSCFMTFNQKPATISLLVPTFGYPSG